MSDLNELVTIENNDIVINEGFMKDWKLFQKYKKEMEAKEKDVKESLLKIMKENGIINIKNDFFTASHVCEGEKDTVDVEKMKEDNIYDAYKKTVKVKEQLRIRWK